MKLINTENLTAGYDKNPLIESIKISVESGKIVTLIGPNGSGKSTILKTVAGIIAPVAGVVNITEKSLNKIDKKELSKIMAVMLTTKQSADYATCRDVVRVGRYPYTGVMGGLSDADEEIVEETMRTTGVGAIADKDFSKISDGQRQRVLLARALVQEPKVLILDEPTSFLDVGYQIEFMEILRKLSAEKKIGILMSLHELDMAASVSDEVVAISKDNRIDKMGAAREVITDEYVRELFGIKNGKYRVGRVLLEEAGTEDAGTGSCPISKTRGQAPCLMPDFAGKDAGPDPCPTPKTQGQTPVSKHTPVLMIQGTMSGAGKSLVVAGLCRILKQDGFKVAPFKSQNMALNSYITEDGLEMGRAQVMQAEAAGIKPDVHMNPILLKPTDDCGSQVIVNGVPRGNMRAREYFEYKTSLIPDIKEAFEYLQKKNDIIVIEGAGSPAEINLKDNDIVNMGMAEIANSPVVLVGDIDRGGVFAQLLGTIQLLEKNEKDRVKGLIVNKFRGDKTILDPGIEMLEARANVPVVGVIPYMDINLEDEDSLSERFERKAAGAVDIAVIRLPHISNFTDFDVFEQHPKVSVRYIKNPSETGNPDLLIIPGSKNTIADMQWLRNAGFDSSIKKLLENDIPVFGICGGYQMLGAMISDPEGVEGGGNVPGLKLLPIQTTLQGEKCRRQVDGTLGEIPGILSVLSGRKYYGYEIHMGRTNRCEDNGNEGKLSAKNRKHAGNSEEIILENAGCGGGVAIASNGSNVYGTYVHGIFDSKEVVTAVIKCLAERKNEDIDLEEVMDYREFKEREYDRLAETMRAYLDMESIYKIMGIEPK